MTAQIIRGVLLCTLWVALVPGPSASQTSSDQRILLRNVRLVDQGGDDEDVIASLIIDKGQLKLITQDEVPTSEADIAFDARQGVLLGTVKLNSPASFVILDEDPRQNVQVLLDTASHLLFAVSEGEVLRNNLFRIYASGDKPRRRGWLAYTPPPIALPLNYGDEKRWNHYQTKPISGIFAAALVLDRQRWFSQDPASLQQVGNLDEYDRGEIRGFRLGFVGTFNFKRPWVYTVFAANAAYDRGFDTLEDDEFILFDWRVDIPLWKHSALSVGKQKEPISMERLMGGLYLPVFERSSVSDAFLPSRNIGLVLNGTTPGQRINWALGAFNDWFVSGEEFSESANQIVGRLTGIVGVTKDESNLFHLGLGARYTDAKEGVRFRTRPETNLSPVFVDTNVGEELLRANGGLTLNAELSWRRGPLWFHSEYTVATLDAPELGDPVLGGFHATMSWIVTGEMRKYNRRSGVFSPVPVAKSVYGGGGGALELGIRWSHIDLVDGAVDGGEMRILAGAVNWWLTSFFSAQMQYRYVMLDRYGLEGTSQGVLGRIVLTLE